MLEGSFFLGGGGFLLVFFFLVLVHKPSSNTVLLHLLIQKHFQKIACTNFLFLTIQSVPLAEIFMFIFHYVFYSLFALQKKFLLLYLVWSEGSTGFNKWQFYWDNRSTWYIWVTTADSVRLVPYYPWFQVEVTTLRIWKIFLHNYKGYRNRLKGSLMWARGNLHRSIIDQRTQKWRYYFAVRFL